MVRTSPLRRVIPLAACVALASASLSIIPVLAQTEPEPAEEVASEAWPATPLPNAEALLAANGQFVAVGTDDSFPGKAFAWTSADGATWQPAAVSGAPDGSQMTALAAIEGGFAALGMTSRDPAAGPTRIAAWHSADGLTWQRADVSRATRRGMNVGVRHVASGPAGLLALGQFFGQDVGPYRLYRSVDGLTWEPLAMPESKNTIWASLVSIPEGYLLIGNKVDGRPSTFRSTDGETWEKVTEAPRLLDAASGPNGTIVGVSDQAIWRTPDLVTWEMVWQTPDPDATEGMPALDWMTWDGAQFATTMFTYEGCPPDIDECYQRALLLSPDGATWTESVGPDGVPGPDQSTSLADIASMDGSTIVLGLTGPGPTVAWQAASAPASDETAG